MELALAVLAGFPLGCFVRRQNPYALYLVLWVLVFPLQTYLVNRGGDLDWSYWVVNAVFLALGLGLVRWGTRSRGAGRRTPVTAA